MKNTNLTFYPVSIDITNHCNARCIFCFNHWGASCNMTKETFNNVLKKILPLSKKEGVLVSCLFEPTLHPNFIEMYSLLPAQYKDNMFFTTNFVRYLPDEEIKTMAKFNVHHINISLETFDEQKYIEITGVKKTFFYDNLTRILKIFKESENPPHIRFITMLIKNNYSEIISLAQKAHSMYPLELHEFRTPYLHGETDLEKILLTENELNDLVPKIHSLGYSNISISADSSLEQFIKIKHELKSSVEGFGTVNTQKQKLHVNYTIRINADGHGNFSCDGSEFDINKISFKKLQEKLFEIYKLWYTHEPLMKRVKEGIKKIPLLGYIMHAVYRKFKSTVYCR